MPKNDSRPDLDQTTTILSVDSEDLEGDSQTLGPSPETIFPRTYHIQHDGWHKGVRIWVLEPPTTSRESSKEPSLASDSKDDLFDDAESRVPLIQTMPYKVSSSSKDQEKEGKKKYPVIDPSRVPASYYIKRSKFAKYVMFQGSGPDDECLWAKKLLTIDGEGILSRNSKYTQADGVRSARMYGQDGPDPVIGWRHFDRTLQDFDGVTYRLHTKVPTILDDVVITRISDGVEIAYFDRAVTSLSVLGTLEIKVPLSTDILHLIVAAWYVKYVVDAFRRRGARST